MKNNDFDFVLTSVPHTKKTIVLQKKKVLKNDNDFDEK